MKRCSNNIQIVIKNLIPPKGFKIANNIEHSWLCDGEDIEENATGWELEDESEPCRNPLEMIYPPREITREVS